MTRRDIMAIPRCLFIGLCIATSPSLLVLAQTSTATWLFPVVDGTIINIIDTFVLQWRSNYADPWMQMWCQNGTAGNNVVQASNFQVDQSGTYPYVLKDEDPEQSSFPVACHAQLATAQNGGGQDSPVGVTFVSINEAQAAAPKTFSLTSNSISTASSATPTTSGASSTSSTANSTPSPSTSPTSSVPQNTSPSVPSAFESPPSGTNHTEGSSDGLSTASKLGIGFGIVAIGIVGATLWVILRKRAALRNAHHGPGVPELGAERWHGHEMDAPRSHQKLEVQPPRRLHEMEDKSSRTWVHEMAA